jgi:hypothetical protein
LFEAGVGANANLLDTRYFETRILGGLGFRQENIWDQWYIDDTLYVDTSDTSCRVCRAYRDVLFNGKPKTIVRRFRDTQTRPEFGPELAWYATLRIGRIATLESEFKLFAPFLRLNLPDTYWRATLSWRVVRMVSLVYDYEYELRRPEEEALKKSESNHRILLRFSYTSR